MWVYILSVALCVCLWKVGKILQCYRLIHKALSEFPLPVDHHWFFGVAHLVSETWRLRRMGYREGIGGRWTNSAIFNFAPFSRDPLLKERTCF